MFLLRQCGVEIVAARAVYMVLAEFPGKWKEIFP